uniref:MFS transporter n=1 Tax=Burkholderia anthina TaxID=179879 RepID=UPI00158EB2B8|nr:MFS transporter [Burkholderia anthina]
MTHPTRDAAQPALVAQATRRACRRLMPFLLLMYVLSFLDRANIGFAKEAMQVSIGISNTAYALGAGLFFLSYSALELPSNLAMHRYGARLWLSRIMVPWGLISAAMMFVRGETSFYALRLLLGVAEAGFVPGVILYLTYWFPDHMRGRMIGLFYFGAPLAFIFGGPVSGLLLQLDGVGNLHGWQWMFMIEGLAASIVGLVAYWYLDDSPEKARWLPDDEKRALVATLANESREKAAHGGAALRRVFVDPRLIQYTVVYFIVQMAVFGVTFYLPTQVAHLLGTHIGVKVGLVTAIPWICAIVASFWVPRIADRYRCHRVVAAITLAISGLGIAVSADSGPFVAIVALCFAASGFIAVQPVLWTFPTRRLAGMAAAGGIGLINGLGLLGGFVAPSVKNFADSVAANNSGGLYVLAALTFVGAIDAAMLRWPDEPAANGPAAAKEFV